jgi:1,4-dihydroxy-2-naphthoyl-CoA hydrolase
MNHATLEEIQKRCPGTLCEALGIEITGIEGQNVLGRMPVDRRTIQMMGVLHGGASAALAETLGSVGANLVVDFPKQHCVGIEINANHLKSAHSGWVYGIARPVKIGRSLHVWDIRITNESNELICVSRLTVAVIRSRNL